MHSYAIRTHHVQAGDSIEELILTYLPDLAPGSIIAIASKIVSLSQHRLSPQLTQEKRLELIRQEAEWADPEDTRPWQLTCHSHHTVLISSGIDESNTPDNQLLLTPNNPMATALEYWHTLSKHYQHQRFGLLITDSFALPLKQGVIGIALGWAGFKAHYDYRGQRDLSGRRMEVSTINVPDILASIAILEMGEGAESQPIAVIEHTNEHLCFTEGEAPKIEDHLIDPIQDIYHTWYPQSLKKKLIP